MRSRRGFVTVTWLMRQQTRHFVISRQFPSGQDRSVGRPVAAALTIACDLKHPIHDCCYLALALEENAVVVTAADRRFKAAVAPHSALADRVVLLRDIAVR
jgi:hypothetical protein